LCDHTTADDASRYRSAEEVNQAWREEPIKRLRAFLCDHTTADDASRYRSAEEVNQAWREEPIKRLRA
ncbi:thiamine pyrophosphate-dependent enzyme, partial [Pseudomonas aeruginosa]